MCFCIGDVHGNKLNFATSEQNTPGPLVGLKMIVTSKEENKIICYYQNSYHSAMTQNKRALIFERKYLLMIL